jgi:hypothetical protein
MKISDLLCQYLYQNKELVLEGFGVFHLDPSVNTMDTKEPQQVYQGITYENNAKLKTSPEFIDFLIQQSGKMRPLATSDLEAFLTTGRELINLGKPLILNGIGTLSGIRYQQLEFTPGPFIPVRLEREGQFKERVATSEDELFRSEDVPGGNRPTGQSRRLLVILAAALVIILAGWGLYHVAFQKKSPGSAADSSNSVIQPVENPAPAAQKDTTNLTAPAKSDTTAGGQPKPTAASIQTLSTLTGPVTFRVLIQSFEDPEKAHRRLDSLKKWGHNVVLETRDSTLSIIMPFSLPMTDTSRVKDSLSDFFGRRVYVLPAK